MYMGERSQPVEALAGEGGCLTATPCPFELILKRDDKANVGSKPPPIPVHIRCVRIEPTIIRIYRYFGPVSTRSFDSYTGDDVQITRLRIGTERA